ncbi:MAG TPA: polysaccharide deacetylase family protein [Acidobacteriota bacterium]|nr:polysaccharide deacetylase family protein [Acidobacteriota bacterium]
MKDQRFALISLVSLAAVAVLTACHQAEPRTEIAKWQDGKAAAISLTYDDNSANQFRVAVPLMKRLGFPATFHIITGEIEGSRYHGAFIGRPVDDVVRETARIPTGPDNFFERAAAIGRLGLEGGFDYHLRAGELFEDGKITEARALIDEAYAKVRASLLKRETPSLSGRGDFRLSWDDLKALADQGFELSSHTITHPRLAVLDDANLDYELEKSRQDILDHLGSKHTFTVECPFGTEDERVVRHALSLYPASRNRLPETFLDELNRWSEKDPAASSSEYVQWQRGALTATPMSRMKGWVDTILGRDNIWLVLVFHGVDGIGWEPKTGAELEEYFGYIKSLESRVWVATFQDAAKYMRERMRARVTTVRIGKSIEVDLRHDLAAGIYDLPLTLKTSVPSGWTSVEIKQGGRTTRATPARDANGAYVLYQAAPNAGPVVLSRHRG